MAYIDVKTTSVVPNFIESTEGLVLKTMMAESTGIEADGYGYKTVKAGTIFPANDGTAIGVIFEDTDVTRGEHAAPVVTAGRLLIDRMPEAPTDEAITALKAAGLYFVAEDGSAASASNDE